MFTSAWPAPRGLRVGAEVPCANGQQRKVILPRNNCQLSLFTAKINYLRGFMKLQMSSLKDRDAGLALAFLILLFWLPYRIPALVYAAMAVLLLAMIWPLLMRPFAWLWFGFGLVMGKFVSIFVLSALWLALVVPVGFVRRLMGKDELALKAWKGKGDSCFITRNHTYTADDLKHPY